ncbi:MAG: DNA methyltransferase [Sandaracinaceae bacterium]
MTSAYPAPTPVYYQDDAVTLYNGDCIAVLDALEPESVAAVVTDPPYASGSRKEAGRSADGKNRMLRGERYFRKPIANDQLTTPGFVWLIREVASAALPAIVDGGHFLSFIDWRQWPNLVGALETAGLRVNNLVVWDKAAMGLGKCYRNQHELVLEARRGVSPGALGPGLLDALDDLADLLARQDAGGEYRGLDALVRETEVSRLLGEVRSALGAGRPSEEPGAAFAAHASKGVPIPRSKATPNVLPRVIAAKRDRRTDHPSPKPLDLAEQLIEPVASPGEIVVDPFAGAGAFLVAAKRMGRRAIGVELDAAHCETAARRLEAVRFGEALDGAEGSAA